MSGHRLFRLGASGGACIIHQKSSGAWGLGESRLASLLFDNVIIFNSRL